MLCLEPSTFLTLLYSDQLSWKDRLYQQRLIQPLKVCLNKMSSLEVLQSEVLAMVFEKKRQNFGQNTLKVQKGVLVVLGPNRSSARFWLKLFGKKARLGSPCLPKSSARHILQKKLGSARLALSFKKPSYLEDQKMS